MFQGMEYIYEVYKERSFSKAAQNLYISQPSLSAMVRKIEARIGSPIFDRSTSPIGLTDCGKEYIKYAEKIMDIQNDFKGYLNNINELKTGQLSIGASNLFASFILPPYISRFTRKYPLVKVNLTEANTPLLEERLAAGSLDLIIDNYTFNKELYKGYPLCPDHLLLAVPRTYLPIPCPDNGLSAQDILMDRHLDERFPAADLKMFRNIPFILLRSGNDTRRRAEQICHHQNFAPHVILKLDQQATAYNLACYGMGAAFVSDIFIKKVRPAPNIIFFRMGEPEAARTIFFYHKNGKYVTKAMQEFLNMAMNAAPYTDSEK